MAALPGIRYSSREVGGTILNCLEWVWSRRILVPDTSGDSDCWYVRVRSLLAGLR